MEVHRGSDDPYSQDIAPTQADTGPRSFPTTRNSAAQLGRNQPRRHEAFLQLARSQRMKQCERQTSTHYRNYREGLPCRMCWCDGATVRRGSWARQMLVPRPIRCDPERSTVAMVWASSPEWEIEGSGIPTGCRRASSAAARPMAGRPWRGMRGAGMDGA